MKISKPVVIFAIIWMALASNLCGNGRKDS